jgi:hypothetical protein
LSLGGGRQLVLDRARESVTYCGPFVADDQLVHPYRGSVGTIFDRWVCREVFHAASFVLYDRAWVVVGPKEAGNSTLVAQLLEQDTPGSARR